MFYSLRQWKRECKRKIRNEKRQDSAATKWQELKAAKKFGPSTRPLPRRSYNACKTPAARPLERAVWNLKSARSYSEEATTFILRHENWDLPQGMHFKKLRGCRLKKFTLRHKIEIYLKECTSRDVRSSPRLINFACSAKVIKCAVLFGRSHMYDERNTKYR